MKGLPPAAGKGVRGPEHPSPFSQLVYTSNDSYIVPLGDFKKIHKAACLGQVEKLEKMTERKTINLNIKDSQKRTALHWACVNGHEEVVTFLVDRKCQLDVLDGENRTPLMKALQCHRKACANILIDSGADVNLVDMYGNTALHYAVYSENLSVVAKLLSHGAVIEVQNKASLTPLLLSITKRREQIVEFLLTKNANANAVNRCKCTALMLAVCHGSSEIVGMLLQKNVDVFAADTCGVTAERYAVACGFHHIHQQILEYIQKLSKNRQNTNPEGTSAGTPDEAAPLAERTPDTAESLVEKPPDEAAPLVEGTSDKIQCLEKATSGKFEQSAEETPREITRPAKETSEKFTGRPRKIAWDNKETPVKTGCVARVTSNKTKVLEKGRSKMIACPTKESSTKASTNVDVSSVESIISLFGKTTIEISQSTEVEEDFNLATKNAGFTPSKQPVVEAETLNKHMQGATKTVTGQQENDIGIIEQAPQDLTNKMPTSESGQKEDTKSPSDAEIISKSAAQNYMCLPDAAYQKDIKTINHNIEDQRFSSESEQEEDEENSWDSGSLLGSSAEIQVCIPKSIYQKVMEINRKVEEPPEKPSAFKPATEMQKSVPNKAFELKTEQTLRADQMFPSESKQKDNEENSWDSESLRETVSQKDVYLPKATHQKEIDKISGKLEDSTSLSKILDAVHSGKRARELAYSKMEQMKRSVLKKQLSEAKEIKSQLENQKVKWEQELCSGRLTLNQEEEKRRNADILNEKIREELGRIEEQHRKELEVKQQLEEALRIQDMELKSVRSNSNQVSHPHKNENDLLHENSMLKKEIAMLKLEIATLKHQYQEKENKYFEDIKILKERNAELQMTLKLKEETLTKRASQYSGQLKVLIAENTMLTSKLKEKQDEEILDTEIESYHPRLASAVQDHDQIVTSRKSQELAFHIAGDACLQGRMNVDVNNTIYNNEVLHQPLSETQRESKSLKIINYAGDALRENTLVSEHAQRDQCETQCQVKKAEHMYQNEQDNVNKHTEQQESVEQKLFQLQSKNMWLRQRLVHAHKKADKKSKITINIQFLERKMQHHLLKEKNEEVFNYVNHLKDRIYQYEKEKAEREVIVRKLQKNLADLNKQCVSEASLEVTSRYHINLKDEIQDLMKK
ncbi:ankyrin repeat domain-containing protein 30A-like isoform X10 [Nomascus leucogenys]|uniref:ankyrin repeat domain-containing protein 30A-like isoform X10 n=1 Tax=Nomascus leucogenys TaxID=61853 RepID=UPI00122DBFF4|nr:ankyrin repeat domain-containing protein 30A-like isoform X10 [Nomascus leucogenys]